MTMACGTDLVEELVSLGVSGVVSKRDDISELIYAVRHHRGVGTHVSKSFQAGHQARRLVPASRRLTRVEIDVLRQLSSGLSVKEIATRRSRSVTTVSRQKASAMKKLCITDHRQLHWYLDSLRGR